MLRSRHHCYAVWCPKGREGDEWATSGSKLLNWPCDEAFCAKTSPNIKQGRCAVTIVPGSWCESGVFVEENSSREKKLRAVDDAADALSLFALCDSNPTTTDSKTPSTLKKALN